MSNIIELKNVNKWFDKFQALKDVSLEVKPQEKIVICGPSGSGKSTLIRCINRLEEHQEGQIIVDGNEISENSRLILKENGIDASKHLSTQISQKIIDETWLILTMTENHKKQLLTLSPNAIYKTFTLSEYTGFKGDIADPYKKDLATYRETFEAIKKRIEKIK